jgi:hypothetical protein
MFRLERFLIPPLALFFTIGFVGARDALAQNGAIINPGPQPVIINPVVEPTVTIGLVGIPFIPPVVQPQFVVTPSVNPNAVGVTDPLGNPYRNLTPNPLTIPIVLTPVVSPFGIPVVQTPVVR